MKKIIITSLLILVSIVATAQIKENLVRMATKNSQFIEKYYPNQLIRIADSLPIFSLTHSTQIGQTMKTVFDSGWYKVITPAPALSMTEPKYFVVLTDSVSVLPTKYPVAPLLSGAVIVTDTTGLDPLCTGLTIYSLSDSTLWQHRPVIDTITGDTIGCEWIDMSTNPYVPNPTIVMSNGSLVPWSDVVAIRQRTPVTFNTKAVPLGSEWYVGVDTVTAQGVATQYDITQIPTIPQDTNLWVANINNIYNKNTGNVGINTTNPITTLDIEGNARIATIPVIEGFADTTLVQNPLTGVVSKMAIGDCPPYDYSPWDTTVTTIVQKNVEKKVHVGSTATPDSLFQVTGGAKFTRDVRVNGVRIGRGNGNQAENTAVGYQALNSNTGTGFNTAVGHQALTSNTTGSANVAVGYNSMLANTDGLQNTALGEESMRENISGQDNAAVGYQALKNNTSYYNVAVGSNAMINHTSGQGCTAVGFSALKASTSGWYNSFLGYLAGYVNTTGRNNTGVGAESLRSNTTSRNNSGFGYKSLYSNTTGYSNTAVGVSALYSNTTASNLVAVGDSALYSNTTGTGNTAVGSKAGYLVSAGTTNQTSSNSIYLGKDTRAGASGNINETVIGYGTIGKGSNTTTIGNTSTTDTYLAGALTIDSIPPYVGTPDSVVVPVKGKLYRTLLPTGTTYTGTSPINVTGSTISIDTTTFPWMYHKGSIIQRNLGDVMIGIPDTTAVMYKSFLPNKFIVSHNDTNISFAIRNRTNGDDNVEMYVNNNAGRLFRFSHVKTSNTTEGFFGDEDGMYGGGGFYFSTRQDGTPLSFDKTIMGDAYSAYNGTNIIIENRKRTIRSMFGNPDSTNFILTSGGDAYIGGNIELAYDTLSNNTATLSILGNGTVGIGTTAPATALDMGASGVITTAGGTSTTWNTAYGWGNHAGLYPPLADSSKWQYNGNDIWYTKGRVGIGTTAPVYNLHVRASNATSATSANSTGYARNLIGSGTSGSYLTIGKESSSGGSLLTGSTGYSSVILESGNYPMYIGTNSSISATISTTGNLGINTTAPASKLHVNGAARIADSTKMLGTVYMTALPHKAGAHELYRDVSTGEISYKARVSRHTPSGDSIPTSALASTIFLSPTGNITFNDAAGGVMEGTYDGQQVTIINLSATYTATFKVTGNILDSGGSNVELGSGESIVIIWGSEETKWYFINKTPSL